MRENSSSDRKLYRSDKGKLILGVCSGLAEFFNIDQVLVRLIFILLSFINGLGIIIYIVLWLILPKGIKVEEEEVEIMGDGSENKLLNVSASEKPGRRSEEIIIVEKRSPFVIYLVLGLFLAVAGSVFLMKSFLMFPNIWLAGQLLWPVVLVIAGLIVIVAGAVRK